MGRPIDDFAVDQCAAFTPPRLRFADSDWPPFIVDEPYLPMRADRGRMRSECGTQRSQRIRLQNVVGVEKHDCPGIRARGEQPCVPCCSHPGIWLLTERNSFVAKCKMPGNHHGVVG